MMMKLILFTYLVHVGLGATANPTWTVNSLLNSGEHKAINQVSGTGLTPSTFNVVQTFNVAFTAAPRVILSLEGYRQNAPCANCQVGFKYSIASITATGFTGTVTIYGANMFFLFYMYLGVSNAATDYFTAYQLLTFTNGNLVDTTSANRSITQTFTNQAGESFPNFATNQIQNIVFLAGFKMNLGTTGTYINLTSSMESATTHSVTIGTRGNVQIFEVCYFRISFDKTAITQGYVSIIDSVYFWGANSTQMPTVTSSSSTSAFQYRNYLMGFNQISLATTAQPSDIMLQFHTTNQTIWASSSVLYNFVNATFEYLLANTFHHRKRVCGATTPYFEYTSEMCYDVCPTRTFPVETTKYCEKCHYSCLTCSGTSSTSCSTCSNSTDFRSFNSSTSTCPCTSGYFENGSAICPACASPCLTCTTTASNCQSCDLTNHHRFLNTTTNVCLCSNGYYETSSGTPLICNTCDPTCATCATSATTCTSCNSTYHRNLNTTSSMCLCIDGFFETSAGTPLICNTCDPTCATCASSATTCTSCDANTQKRTLNSSDSSCVCINGYYQSTTNGTSSCLSCHQSCLTCSGSANTCASCDSALNRTLNSNASTCTCNDGYYQTTINSTTVCQLCSTNCLTCSSSGSNCMSCRVGLYLDTVNNTGCQPCSITGCTNCRINSVSQAETCTTCNASAGYYLHAVSSTRSICKIPSQRVCGNGIKEVGEECDDYNLVQGDGCSSVCQVEASHACEQYSNQNGTSLCYYNQPLSLSIDSVLKLLDNNKITIGVKVQAINCNLDKLKQYLDGLTAIELRSAGRLLERRSMQALSTIIYITSASFTITNAPNYEGYLDLLLEYTQSISTLQNKKISFLSSRSENSGFSRSYFFATPESALVLEDPHNKVPIKFYDVQSYQAAASLSYVFLAIIILNFLFFIVAIFLRKTVVPVESLLIFQFAYFGVVGLSEVELAIASLAYLGKFSIGVNISFLKTNVATSLTYQSCSKMGKIYQECNSINNINITFYLAAVTFLVYLGCVAFKYKKQRDLDKIREDSEPSEEVSDAAKQRQNNSEENQELEDRSQTSSAKSGLRVFYQLPDKIRNASLICLEFSTGMFYLTAIEYLLTAINQGSLYRIPSAVWLAFVGLFFVGLWVVYFKSYPISQLSYVEIVKSKLEKITAERFAYFCLFMFLVVWGMLLAVAPGIAAYSLLIVWCLFWQYLTIRKQIYRSRIHKLRSCLNQIITFLVAIIFIVLEYGPKNGMGLAQSICLVVLLLASFIVNLSLYLYDRRLESKMSELSEDENEFKNAEDEFQNYSSRKSENPQFKQEELVSHRKNAKLKLFEMSSPKRQSLMEHVQMKETVHNKLSELKNLRKELNELKINRPPAHIADQKKVQLVSSIKRANNEASKIHEDSQYKDL